MKKITLLLIVALIAVLKNPALSSTLVFNQVLLINNTSASPASVPAGKVWKVVSYIYSNNSNSYNGAAYCNNTGGSMPSYIYVNGNSYFMMPVSGNPTSSGQWGFGVNFPMWLPAGTTLATNCSTWCLSVLEFTVQ